MAEFGIESAPPGVVQNAGTGCDIAATVDEAVAMAMARRESLEASSQGPGAVVGDALPLTGPVDYDTTVLMPLPGVPIGPPDQGGSYDGSNIGGRS
jgi:hypothetical protein